MKRNWVIVGAVAAMLAVASTGAGAQDNTGTAGTGTDTTTSAGMNTNTSGDMGSGSMSNGTMSDDIMGTPDYTLLNNKNFDYTDLQAAKARGLKEDEVAATAQIAERTGVPFQDIADAVLRGETFAKLADQYNLRLSDVLDVSDEKTKIANYEAAYRNTGIKGMGMNDGMNTGMTAAGTDSGTMGTGTTDTTGAGTTNGTDTNGAGGGQ